MLHAHSLGRGDKVVVLLHGFGGHHEVWQDIQRALATDAKVLAYDLPGHGRSLEFDKAGPTTVAAKAIVADLGGRGVEAAHFVGHSMGGAIATLIALREPLLVASLTLLVPGGMGPEINFDLLRRYGAATDAATLRSLMEEMSAPRFKMPLKPVASSVAVRSILGQNAILRNIADLITRSDCQGVIPREAIAALPMPVTVVWGSEDPVLPFHQTENLPPNVQLIRLAGHGHMLLEEARDRVIQIIRQATR